MKKILKKFPFAIFILAITLNSCESESVNELTNQNDFDQNSFNITAKYENIIVGQDYINNNTYSYFVNNKLYSKTIYTNNNSNSLPSNYVLSSINDNTIRISNTEDLTEYYELRNIVETNGLKTFDIHTSNGQILYDIELNSSSSSMTQARSPWVWLGAAVVAAVEAIMDGTTDSDCQTAIKECREAGGLPSTTIEDGFFGSSCSVTCAEKK